MRSLSGLKLLFFIPALAYTALVTYLSLINLAGTSVSKMGVGDKAMHLGAYFGMALLWLLFAFFNYKNEGSVKKIIGICILVIVFGIFIEVLQRELTDYRQLDLYDVLANSIGAVAAGLLVWFLKEILTGLKTRISSFFMKK